MRSGPSIAATSCRTRRQRKRNGGPSGTSATASIGSGRTKSRKGRAGAPAAIASPRPSPRVRASPSVAGAAASACSGRCASIELAPRHRARPEPRAQAVDEVGERTRPLGLMRAVELDLRRRERLGRKAREAHEIDAEAGVDRVFLRARQLLGEEPRDGARFVQRPGGADPDAAHVAVDPIEAELDRPCSLGLPLEQHDEIVGEPAQGRLDRLERLNGRGEPPLGAEIGRRRSAARSRSARGPSSRRAAPSGRRRSAP